MNPGEVLLWRSLALFLLVVALAGVALALLLIFRPHFLERVNRVANRWISTRHLNQMLDRSISVERWFYRHHQPAGMAVVAGAAYLFVYFGMLFDKPDALHYMTGRVPLAMLGGLLDALVLGALTGAAAALMVGLFLWLRPSLLHGMEDEANQWVSSRRATRLLDVPHDQVDRFVARHARATGWLLLVGSIYLFFAMFRLLV